MVRWGLRVCLCLSQQLYLQRDRGMNRTRDWVKSDTPTTTPKKPSQNTAKTELCPVRMCSLIIVLFCCPELFLHDCSGSWVLRERELQTISKMFFSLRFFSCSWQFFSAFPSMCWKEQACL